MTIQGRRTEKWGRDKSARWDSHEGNGFRTRSYPHVDVRNRAVLDPELKQIAGLEGRPGYAERNLGITRTIGKEPEDIVTVHLDGWYETAIEFNERQIAFLRDTLNAWFPPE